MKAIRSYGSTAFQELSDDMTRLTDWREHVRAKPLPFMFAAAALGYLLVPARRTNVAQQTPKSVVPLESNGVEKSTERFVNKPFANKLRATAWAYASRWVQNYVTNLVKDQIRNVVEQPDDHLKRTERQQTFRIHP
jgi:hypothetical protein